MQLKLYLLYSTLLFTVGQCVEINHDLQSTTSTLATTSDSSIDDSSTAVAASSPTLQVKRGLNGNYTRKYGERVRFECEFDYSDRTRPINQNDLTLYWVKNYQELLHSKKGFVHVIRKNMSTILVMRNLEEFDSGSYMCVAELNTHDNQQLNASSETTLVVQQQQQSSNVAAPSQAKKQRYRGKASHNHDMPDYLLGGDKSGDEEDDDELADEFPQLNPTIVENYDDKGFCEPYRGTVCAGIITGNYSVYSTSSQQQDLIEERLKTIVPLLLSNKNNLSKRCATFAVPSLCLFAFPLCDRQTRQPKQICRFDCKQLQQDICKNEYVNVKTLFETTKLDLGNTGGAQQLPGNSNAASQQQNFLLDCNQLPPSSDIAGECVPIVTMTLDKLESTIIEFNQKQQQQQQQNVPTQNCIITNGVEYRGTQSVTRNGFTCQRWSDQYPHMHSYKSIPELAGHNYCRNVDNDVEPWCFTTNPNQRKDYCYIPKCVAASGGNSINKGGGYIDQTPLDNAIGGIMSEKKLMNLLYILLPSVLIPFLLLCILLTFCYCRRASAATAAVVGDKAGNSVGNNNFLTAQHDSGAKINGSGVSGSANGSAGVQLNPSSRLRMSNASLGGQHNKQHQMKKNGRACSSKSSVASGSTTTNTYNNNNNNNGEMNPFLKQQQQQQQQQQHLHQQQQNNYDNYYNQFGTIVTTANSITQQQQQFQHQQQHMVALQSVAQCLMPPPPPLPLMSSLGLQQQQPLSDYTPLRQVSASDIRLSQEIGKGRFGPVYIGDLLGNNNTANSTAAHVTVKTFDRKLFSATKNKSTKTQSNIADHLMQATSTPNVHNLNKMNKNNEATATASAANDDDLPSAEEHFMEQEFYNEISLYSNLRHKYLANLIALNTAGPQRRRQRRQRQRQQNLDSDLDEEEQRTSDENDDEFDDNDIPKCMIFEHLNLGNLHEYLLQRQQQQINTINHHHQQQMNQINNIYGSQSNLSAVSSSVGGASTSNYLQMQQQQRNIADFLYIGLQIASGMEYLAAQNFVLKDLAARNVLMSDTLTIKISVDLVGQYGEQYSRDYYKFQGKLLPVRWMAPECLLYGRYTQQSDVWSYGVCLWEVFSYGQQPYAGCTSPEAIEMIRDRQLLSAPEDCPQRAYALMLECWADLPTQRPTFTDIINKLRNWENYYLFNGYQPQQVMMVPPPPPQLIMPPPLPPPQQQQQQSLLPPLNQMMNGSNQMTSSYSSNSQASKTSSSLMGNTISTGVSSMASLPPPPPPTSQMPPQPLLTQYHQNGVITTSTCGGGGSSSSSNGYFYSPSKANLFGTQRISPPSSNLNGAAGQFNRYFRDTLDPMSSLRMSQRHHNYNGGGAGSSTFASSIFANIPTATTTTISSAAAPSNMDHHF